jgi:hypothetical protein
VLSRQFGCKKQSENVAFYSSLQNLYFYLVLEFTFTLLHKQGKRPLNHVYGQKISAIDNGRMIAVFFATIKSVNIKQTKAPLFQILDFTSFWCSVRFCQTLIFFGYFAHKMATINGSPINYAPSSGQMRFKDKVVIITG